MVLATSNGYQFTHGSLQLKIGLRLRVIDASMELFDLPF
jgi:hypothetical protein